MSKTIFALVLAGAILFALVACAPEEIPATTRTEAASTSAPLPTGVRATATSAPQASGICAKGKPPSYLLDVVLAKGVQGQDFVPVEVSEEFAPDQATIHLIATVEGAPAGVNLRAVWYLVQAVGFNPNSKLDESESAADPDGSGNVDFTLKPESGPWPPGIYCVELYTEGNLALSRTFRVVEGAAAGAVNPIVAIVFAEAIKPATFEPVNPTTTFKRDAPIIYASVQVKDSPPGTKYRARWFPPGINPIDIELVPGPNVWLDFHLTPGDTGFPTGEYRVEFYVNDQLVDMRNFKVE